MAPRQDNFFLRGCTGFYTVTRNTRMNKSAFILGMLRYRSHELIHVELL